MHVARRSRQSTRQAGRQAGSQSTRQASLSFHLKHKTLRSVVLTHNAKLFKLFCHITNTTIEEGQGSCKGVPQLVGSLIDRRRQRHHQRHRHRHRCRRRRRRHSPPRSRRGRHRYWCRFRCRLLLVVVN